MAKKTGLLGFCLFICKHLCQIVLLSLMADNLRGLDGHNQMKKIKNIFKKMSTPESDIVNEQNEEQTPQEETNTVEDKDKQLIELKAKADETNDKYLRLYSEFDNFRKRTAKEKVELMQSAGEDVFNFFHFFMTA